MCGRETLDKGMGDKGIRTGGGQPALFFHSLAPSSATVAPFEGQVSGLDLSRFIFPGLKFGLTEGDGGLLENWYTSCYDMSVAGTWQKREGSFETPLDTAGGHLTLERGGKGVRTQVKAWIDDVQLELLEAP
jgi:hypothetical protein